MIITICNIYRYSDREKQLLPHFIKHYREILKTTIVFCCDQNNHLFHNFCTENNIIYHTSNFEYDKIYGSVDSMRINNINSIYKCWYIPTDLDELIDFGSAESLQDMVSSCMINNYKYISGYLVDRFVAKDQILESIDPNIDISKQFPYSSSLTKDIMGAHNNKVCLISPDINVDPGHHKVILDPESRQLCKNPQFNLCVNHYKWFGDILKLEKEKMIIRLNNNSLYAIEQQKLLEYFNYD